MELDSRKKIDGRRSFVGAKDRREGHIEELVGDQNPGPQAPPRSRKGPKRWEQKNVRGGSM